MKTVVFITGTNAVGKSTLARAIMERYGGIARTEGQVTFCKDGGVAFAGRYDTRYGGVDRITNERGSSCTSALAGVVAEALRSADTVFCEGSFMNTFGLNLSNALFKGDRQLVVSLYTSALTLYARLNARSAGMRGDGTRNWQRILGKQTQAMVSAQKWQSIGVPVIQVDTATIGVEPLTDIVLNKLHELQR